MRVAVTDPETEPLPSTVDVVKQLEIYRRLVHTEVSGVEVNMRNIDIQLPVLNRVTLERSIVRNKVVDLQFDIKGAEYDEVGQKSAIVIIIRTLMIKA